MTERPERPAAWAPRDRGERHYSHLPKGLKPHPDHGDLPPCEMGRGSSRPCPRSATTLVQGMYVCDDHFGWMNATESHQEAEAAVYEAKRMLWRSQMQDVPTLEEHLAQALTELELELEEAAKTERAAWKRASGSEEDPDVR